jgi:hypothetical protein
MRFLFLTTLAIGLSLLVADTATAQATATQNVTVTVAEINALSVSGPVTLNIDNVVAAGDQPSQASDASSSYNITTNGTDKKITAVLDTDFPTGISVNVQFAAPGSGAVSTGAQQLSTSALEVVTGVSQMAASNVAISYAAAATVDAEPTSGETRVVTFTVTDA